MGQDVRHVPEIPATRELRKVDTELGLHSQKKGEGQGSHVTHIKISNQVANEWVYGWVERR